MEPYDKKKTKNFLPDPILFFRTAMLSAPIRALLALAQPMGGQEVVFASVGVTPQKEVSVQFS